MQEIGRGIPAITEDKRDTTFLFQRLSVALHGEMRSHSLSLIRKIDPNCSYLHLFVSCKRAALC